MNQVTTRDLGTFIRKMDLTELSFSRLLVRLGDTRETWLILQNVQRMISGHTPMSGEMQVIITLLERDQSRARRLAQTISWDDNNHGGYTAEIQDVRLSISPRSGNRWSVDAQHVVDELNGCSPDCTHWRNSLEAAKIRAVLAIDETLDKMQPI